MLLHKRGDQDEVIELLELNLFEFFERLGKPFAIPAVILRQELFERLRVWNVSDCPILEEQAFDCHVKWLLFSVCVCHGRDKVLDHLCGIDQLVLEHRLHWVQITFLLLALKHFENRILGGLQFLNLLTDLILPALYQHPVFMVFGAVVVSCKFV